MHVHADLTAAWAAEFDEDFAAHKHDVEVMPALLVSLGRVLLHGPQPERVAALEGLGPAALNAGLRRCAGMLRSQAAGFEDDVVLVKKNQHDEDEAFYAYDLACFLLDAAVYTLRLERVMACVTGFEPAAGAELQSAIAAYRAVFQQHGGWVVKWLNANGNYVPNVVATLGVEPPDWLGV